MNNVATTVDISKAQAIGGWMSDGELLWLATMAQTHKNIVEFGSHHGKSTMALADNNHGIVWAVDPWAGEYKRDDGTLVPINTYVYPYFYQNLKHHINLGHVIPVRQFSYNFDLPQSVDMVFIDGDHRYETVVKDIKKGLKLLKIGGLLCGHDYGHPDWPGVKKAVDLLGYEVNHEETIWWTLKS